jgi:hypothetical protein
MTINVEQVTGTSVNVAQGVATSVNVQSFVAAQMANVEQVTGTSVNVTQGAATSVAIAAYAPALYYARLVSVLDSRFGAKGDGVTDDNVALQSCANYCANTGKVMYFPWTGAKYLTSRPIVPHRTKGLEVFLDAEVKNTDPAFDKINLNGVVFWGGCITHPYQSKLEGKDSGAFLHRLTSLRAGQREIQADATLYNALSVGEIVLLRSDLLAVDRTGEAVFTAGSRRYGVYNFSVLNKVTDKYLDISGNRIIAFEHAIEEDVYEPRLLRFPLDEYVDTFQDAPKLYIGPCENFKLYATDRAGVETSGNQAFIQATCLYNFHIGKVRVIDAVGGVLCNSLCYGTLEIPTGNVRGSLLEIAFNSTNVRCIGTSSTVRGRGDRTNPNVSDGTNTMRNKGAGAIGNNGVIDYNFDAVWYASDNRRAAVIYNKDSQEWDYFTSGSAMWSTDTLPTSLTSPTGSGWGSDRYVPEGTEGGVTMTKALSINRSTVNIHEGARNIWIDDLEVVVASDYDFLDQDINLVGSGISVSHARIYSNKFIDIQSGDTLEGDSISIGNAINNGDIPFSINDIDLSDVTTTGRPVNGIVSVTECPLFPGQDNTTITLQGNLAGALTKLTYNYLLSGSTLAGGTITRAAATTENPEDRYYAYYSASIDTLMVFSLEGFAGKGKGWYLLPAASVSEPASAGGTLTGVVFESITDIYDADDSFTFDDFGDLDFAVYLGENCEYVIFGPCRQFANADDESITFIPNVSHRTFRGLSFEKVKGKRAALRGVHVRGGVRNFYSDISMDRFVPSDVTSANVPSTRFFVDVETVNSRYVSGNFIERVSTEDDTMVLGRETVRDQGYSNEIKGVMDNRSKLWRELNRRYFRTSISDGITMRNVLDNSPAFSVTWPLLQGQITGGSTVIFDALNWLGEQGFRTGYSLSIKFFGVASGNPNLNVKGGNPLGLATIHSIGLSGDFELDITVQFLDALGATNGSWVAVSHVLKNGGSHEAGNDIADLATGGGTRQIAFEFVTTGGQQVDLYSYEVEARDNH